LRYPRPRRYPLSTNARGCPAGAAPRADCLQPVNGAVTGVAEFAGSGRVSSVYALDVRTAARSVHITFTSDSPMLGYAVDGDPAVVTMWRGIPVAVTTDGRTEATASVPDTAFAKNLGECGEAAGVGALFVLAAAGTRRNRRVGAGPQFMITRPLAAVGGMALLLGGLVFLIGGILLADKPSRLDPDLAVSGTARAVIVGLCGWLGISVRHRARGQTAALALRAQALAESARNLQPPGLPETARTPAPSAVIPLRTRLRAATRRPGLVARTAEWVMVLLTPAVLFGVFFTALDGPPARAFRDAPACVGEANLAACAGEFTATVNGVRTPANSASYADVSYVTADGVINTWAEFDGNAAALARTAEADQNDRAQLRIEVWRRSIVGAELGDTWHWADGNPPADTIPAVFLAISFALLLLVVRVRIHRRAEPRTRPFRRRLITDDLGQTAAAAGAIVLLAFGASGPVRSSRWRSWCG
jgi:hypothetical protein